MTSDDYYAFNQANSRVQPPTFVGPQVWNPDYNAEFARRYGRGYAPDMRTMVTDPRSGNRMVKTGAILAALGAGGVFGAGLAAGGAGAAGAGASMGAGVGSGTSAVSAAAPATSGLWSGIGRVASSQGANLAVNAGLAYAGMRSQDKANTQARNDAMQARQDTLIAQAQQLALARQQLEMEARNADLDREDARQLQEAINELKRRELDAAEEARSFERNQILAREARLEPYRQISRQAAERLMGLWS